MRPRRCHAPRQVGSGGLPPEPPSFLTTSIDVVERSIVQAAAVIGALCVTIHAAVELLRH
ncbi:hypothetical protein ACFVTC_18570 [Streptomyces sp. NPDC057950]|uniref:hypothetical protein n=1 Tax=Streptomyces sp. NPDC057950 TaxID=3346288 RepID=UPI0036E35463